MTPYIRVHLSVPADDDMHDPGGELKSEKPSSLVTSLYSPVETSSSKSFNGVGSKYMDGKGCGTVKSAPLVASKVFANDACCCCCCC